MGRQSQDREGVIVQGKVGATSGCRDQEAGHGDVTTNLPVQSLEGEVKLSLKVEAEREAAKMV